MSSPLGTDWHKRKTCLRKVPLKLDWASKIIKRAKNQGRALFKYKCPYCKKYHVTHKDPSKRKKK